MQFSLGLVTDCPFGLYEMMDNGEGDGGIKLNRESEDRTDMPVDYRFVDLLVRESEDPEVSLGSFAKGVRVGPGTRFSRPPVVCAKEAQRWRIAEQTDPVEYLERNDGEEPAWRSNCSSVSALGTLCHVISVADLNREKARRNEQSRHFGLNFDRIFFCCDPGCHDFRQL